MEHEHKWKTIRPLRREGEGRNYSIQFLRKCQICGNDAIKTYYPAILFDGLFKFGKDGTVQSQSA